MCHSHVAQRRKFLPTPVTICRQVPPGTWRLFSHETHVLCRNRRHTQRDVNATKLHGKGLVKSFPRCKTFVIRRQNSVQKILKQPEKTPKCQKLTASL